MSKCKEGLLHPRRRVRRILAQDLRSCPTRRRHRDVAWVSCRTLAEVDIAARGLVEMARKCSGNWDNLGGNLGVSDGPVLGMALDRQRNVDPKLSRADNSTASARGLLKSFFRCGQLIVPRFEILECEGAFSPLTVLRSEITEGGLRMRRL